MIDFAKLLDYDPLTGDLTWKVAPSRKPWLLGQVAGSIAGNGYKQVKIAGRIYAQHRIAFLLLYGWLPDEIDHINGNKQDNRAENLRGTTRSGNAQNIHRTKGKSGLLGASLERRRGHYTSQISVGGRHLYLGSFETPEQAHAAYIAAKIKHHPMYAPNVA